MDIYDYNEDNLSMIARTCSYSKHEHSIFNASHSGELSCSSCSHWNGRGCSKKHLDDIASQMYLD